MTPFPEYVVLVDDNDQVLGRAEKLAAHQQGLLHRAFSVFLFRKGASEVELLLQRRALHKYHAGGLWSNSCCSHPREGEDIRAAGERRLFEELGIQARLQVVGRFQYRAEFANGLIEHELDYLLIGWEQNQEVSANPSEVMETQWVPLKQAIADYEQNPQQFTPWFRSALELVLPHLSLGQE